MNKNVFPWQIDLWRRLAKRLSAMPHAMLLYGPKGIGKLAFAEFAASAMLCESRTPDGLPCGACAGCGWFALGNHPDYRAIVPEVDAPPQTEEGGESVARSKTASRQIRIDQIRALQDWAAVGGHRSLTRVAVIHPAEAMNMATANALLKTLEEPPPGAIFMLVSHQADRLLPTIRSRCQLVAMPRPAREDALAWLAASGQSDAERALALAGGAPLAVADKAQGVALAAQMASDLSRRPVDPIAVADGYSTVAIAEFVDLLQKWLHDVVSIRLGGTPRYFSGFSTELERGAASVDPVGAAKWWRELAQSRAMVEHPLNPRLVVESLFGAYRSLQR